MSSEIVGVEMEIFP